MLRTDAGGAPVTVGGDSGQSWLEVIAHGIGVYFIAKGLWMARSLHLQGEQRNILAKLLEAVATRRGGGQPPV